MSKRAKALYNKHTGKKCVVKNQKGETKGIVCGYFNTRIIMAVTSGQEGWKPSEEIEKGIKIKKNNDKGYQFVKESEIEK